MYFRGNQGLGNINLYDHNKLNSGSRIGQSFRSIYLLIQNLSPGIRIWVNFNLCLKTNVKSLDKPNRNFSMT